MPNKLPATTRTAVVDTFHQELMRFRFEFLAAGVKSGHGMDSQPHRHPAYELFYFESAGGQHEVDFVQMPIAAGMLHWVKPGQVHFLNRDAHCQGFVVQFDLSFFTDERDQKWFEGLWLHRQAHSGHQAILLDALAQHEVMSFMQTWKQYASELAAAELDRLRLRLLLAHAERCYYNQWGFKQPASTNEKALFQAFRQLVEQHFYNQHHLAFYTSRLHCSHQTLARETKRLLGKSPLLVLHERILLEAKSMLMLTRLSNKEIAFALGFEDPAYFGRFIKKQTGHSPEQMRKYLKEKYQ